MTKTNDDRHDLELLSPARDLACGVSAIDCGADAVYIGGPAFSARSQAGNSIGDIEKLARHAHRYNAKVYVALNTLLFDSELDEARRLAEEMWSAGADALIVQDMALAEMGLAIPLHASTQCDNRTPEKARFLEDAGFSQIVLARELSLEEIREIAAATTVKLEYFIHGALCVSMSGLCNLSRLTSDRSANRGVCAQPCRLPWKLSGPAGEIPSPGKHLLSLKDMCQAGNLGLLAEAGISSFKIEGRLKDISYVRNVTAYYRRELDALLEEKPAFRRSSSGSSTVGFTPNPAKSFNRGFTTYMLKGEADRIESFNSPKWIGEEIGKAVKTGRAQLVVETTSPLANGDGLTFFDGEGLLRGIRVNKVEGAVISPATPFTPPPDGATLYRNHDERFESMLSAGGEKRKIAAFALFRETADGFNLRLVDEDGNEGCAALKAEKIPAKDSEAAFNTLREKLSKLGDTIFEAEEIGVEWSRPWFLPVSTINGLRREAAQKLLKARESGYRREKRRPEAYPAAPYPGGVYGPSENAVNRLARSFYERHGAMERGKAWETSPVADDTPLMITKHCLRRSFNLCPKINEGVKKASPLTLKNGDATLKLVFDCRACEMILYKA